MERSYRLLLPFIILSLLNASSFACKYPFEGFGVFMGRLEHFNKTSESQRKIIMDKLYNDLNIRLFRSEYLPQFSTEENRYEIKCTDTKTCAWMTMHSMIGKLPEKDLFISIWSPPYYMKNLRRQLKPEYEDMYHQYLNNVTALVAVDYNTTVSQISLANEPENMFAAWDECTMSAAQLCRLVKAYKEPYFSVCPENAYYWVSEIYRDYSFRGVDCKKTCSIIITHTYQPNLNPLSPNFLSMYYDLKLYPEPESPVWITEVSSTRYLEDHFQMEEAMDLSESIINFVGTTCVQRFYYWLAYIQAKGSGEALIWGVKPLLRHEIKLYYPKKYFAYRHFTRASFRSSSRTLCSTGDYKCLQFDTAKIFLNRQSVPIVLKQNCTLCCTDYNSDWNCSENNTLPSESVCSCQQHGTM